MSMIDKKKKKQWNKMALTGIEPTMASLVHATVVPLR
jgi:hypothetical protein